VSRGVSLGRQPRAPCSPATPAPTADISPSRSPAHDAARPIRRRILDKLVAFDTVSRHSNLALIEWVARYLRGHGVEPVVLPSRDGAKANLFATIGPRETPGVLLSALGAKA
jgi:hypothetical protein